MRIKKINAHTQIYLILRSRSFSIPLNYVYLTIE